MQVFSCKKIKKAQKNVLIVEKNGKWAKLYFINNGGIFYEQGQQDHPDYPGNFY